MIAPPATSFYEVILAIHIMAVVIAFGVTFAYPIMFAVGARRSPQGLPLLHRIEYTIERWLINPGLLLVVIAGIVLASDGHHWRQFFVQWGLGAAIVIGGLIGSVMIPTAKRAEQVATRDLAASLTGTASPAGATGGSQGPSAIGAVALSGEYQRLVRRLQIVGSLLSLLVLVTILFMVIKP